MWFSYASSIPEMFVESLKFWFKAMHKHPFLPKRDFLFATLLKSFFSHAREPVFTMTIFMQRLENKRFFAVCTTLEHVNYQRRGHTPQYESYSTATMNRNQGKQGGKSSDSSPLSLLVHAADAQQQPPGSRGGGSDRGSKNDQGYRHDLLKDKAPSALEEHQLLLQRKAAAEHALQQQGGLLPSLDFYQQNALAAAAQQQQQQQQLASLALASDIRSALAAAHLRQQAAQFQNHDFLLARAAAAQGLGLGGGGLGNSSIEKLQQDLELQRLEELERRQQLLAAAGRAPMQARQQMEMQEAQARQEQLDRQLQREGLLAAATARSNMASSSEVQSNPGAAAAAAAAATATRRDSGKEEFQKTPGSVIVPCRARGMPMDHNFKVCTCSCPTTVTLLRLPSVVFVSLR